jgi:hypothetical protein
MQGREKLTKIQRMRKESRETTRTSTKPKWIVNWRLLDTWLHIFALP